MVSTWYAALLALLIVGLSFRVIKLRQSKKISLGDGGETDLQIAIRAQANATEYIPISLILLILLEVNSERAPLIHGGGLAILVGRLLHARGLLTSDSRYRVLGMQLTITTLILLSVLNLVYVIHANLRYLRM